MYVTYMYMCRYKLLVSCLNWYRIIIKVTYRSMEQVKCLTPRQSFSLFFFFFFFFFFYELMLYFPVNNYGHVGGRSLHLIRLLAI